MAKADLTWREDNVKTAKATPHRQATVDHLDTTPTAVVEDRAIAGPMMKALRVTQTLVIYSVLQQEATDFAIDGMCGEVTWGTCDRGIRLGQSKR